MLIGWPRKHRYRGVLNSAVVLGLLVLSTVPILSHLIIDDVLHETVLHGIGGEAIHGTRTEIWLETALQIGAFLVSLVVILTVLRFVVRSYAQQSHMLRQAIIDMAGGSRDIAIPDALSSSELKEIADALDKLRGELCERDSLQSSLTDAERRWHTALEAAGLGVWEYDFERCALYVSDLWLAQVGYTHATYDPADDRWAELVLPEDRARAVGASTSREAVSTGRFSIEYRMRHRDGHIVHILDRGQIVDRFADGRPKRVIGTHADVTRQREQERAIRDMEERWAFALDNSGLGVWDTDLISGNAFYSRAWLDMLGLSRTQGTMDFASFVQLIHPDDRERFVAANEAHKRGETATFSEKFRCRHRDGHWVWIHDRGKVIAHDDMGQPKRMIGTHEDITPMVTISAALEDARDKAEAAAKAKADFLANMTHELRTPLTGILGAIDLMLCEADGLPSHLIPVIEAQRQAGRSLLQIINDILDYSKMESGQMTLEDHAIVVGEFVANCTAILIGPSREKRIDLLCHVTEDVPPEILGDPARLRQILLNFLSNALKFTPEHGQVCLMCRLEGEGTIAFEVRDSGIGIAADALPRLFDRFTQADGSISRRYGGTGLGLAISRRLAEMMGGEIRVESTPGVGSCFTVILPLRAARRPVPQAAPEPADAGSIPDLRVLLVEDNALNRMLIEKMLVRNGLHVTTASDGAEALDVLTRTMPRFDLVLMDVQMPGMDGHEATRRIRANPKLADQVVIGLSANTDQADIDASMRAGMDGYLSKPVNWPTLMETIRHHVPGGAVKTAGAA